MELAIYISGKVTGEDETECRAKFSAIEARLKQMGVTTVINPKKLGIPLTWAWADAMDLCVKVLHEHANSILMLNDWTQSDGAIVEYYHAINRGYQVFFENDLTALENIFHPDLKDKQSGKWIDTSHVEFP